VIEERIQGTDTELLRVQTLLDTTLVHIDQHDSNVVRYQQIQNSIDVEPDRNVKQPGMLDFESMDDTGRRYTLILLLERLRIAKQFNESQTASNQQRIKGMQEELEQKRTVLLEACERLRKMHELRLVKLKKKHDDTSGFGSLFKKRSKRHSIKDALNVDTTPLPPELDPTSSQLPLGDDHAHAIQTKLAQFYTDADNSRFQQREALARLKESYLSKIQSNLKTHMRRIRELLVEYDKHKLEMSERTQQHEALVRDFEERVCTCCESEGW
jgi:hypothetical protein